jgi:septal ring factor EnvC (AmiA/AmiB activator)
MRLTPPLSNIAASSSGALCAAAVVLLATGATGGREAWGETPDRSSLQFAQTDAGKNAPKSLDGKSIDIEEARRLFEQHQKELENVQRQQEGLESETQTLSKESATLQSRLIEVAQRAQQSEKRLSKSETELEGLTRQETEIRVALEESRTTIAQMLGVMQRMGREPPPVMVTERNDALRMVRSAMILSSFFPGFKAEADRLATRLADLNSVIRKSRDERTRMAEAQADFSRLKAEIDGLLVQKREKLQKNWQKLEGLKVASTRHSRAVTDLGDLLKRLDAEVGKRSNLAAYEAELKKLGPVIEIKPDVKKAAFVQPGRMKPAIPFEKAKGLLPLPSQGKRTRSFGARDDTGGKSEGISIETRSEAQITAPSDGWVIYAGQFRSYGQLLIINAGGGYHILLAGLDQIYTNVGQFVLAGEPVAAMSKVAPQDANSAQSRNPVLYIEFRKDARPFDPDPWWSEGVKEG